jgi:hypothetical protein
MALSMLEQMLHARGWFYDNGASHDGLAWSMFIDETYASPNGYLVILTRGGEGRLLKYLGGRDYEEIWAGPLSCEEQVEELMTFIRTKRDAKAG